ncbi:hypothetical protein SHKM778_43480 [Streptomyces sp. KM77-8]|uniref:ABC transporter permease n=1 Tax=Streptomyces haneummycinicus TaxID=3074435 RepID=A0AAT9HKT0_9ACTN
MSGAGVQRKEADRTPSLTQGVRFGAVSFVWRPWLVLVTLLLAAVTFLLFCVSIAVGTSPSHCPR